MAERTHVLLDNSWDFFFKKSHLIDFLHQPLVSLGMSIFFKIYYKVQYIEMETTVPVVNGPCLSFSRGSSLHVFKYTVPRYSLRAVLLRDWLAACFELVIWICRWWGVIQMNSGSASGPGSRSRPRHWFESWGFMLNLNLDWYGCIVRTTYSGRSPGTVLPAEQYRTCRFKI